MVSQKIKKKKPPAFNEQQVEVINHGDGPCLVIAVAGAGKTTAVVHRIRRLIKEDNVRPEHILAVTFTKKAADEMNERLKKLYVDTDLMQVSTFHSICYKILKEEVPNLPELDATGSKSSGLLTFVLGYQNLNWQNANLAEVDSFISSCKNELKEPKDAKENFQFSQAYELFEKFKKKKKFITFDDLLIMTYNLFMKEPKILKRWQRRFKYVIVDEFQDTNTAQYELMRLLAIPENNLMVVGDDDQSIYSWRGAVPDYMLNFEKEFGATVIRMEKNYRCPAFIGRIANPLIATNVKRLSKTLETQKKDKGDLQLFDSFDFDEEADTVIEYVRTLPEFINGKQLSEISVLYRTNAQSRALEDAFISANIPYEVVGGGNFYDRKEIKDILMYFYAALNIDDRGDEGFQRIINIPFRYLGRTFIMELNEYCEKQKLSFGEALRDMPMTRNQSKQVGDLLRVIDTIKNKQKMEPSLLISNVVQAIGYEAYIKRFEGEGDIENSRMGNVKELIRASGKFKTIKEYINHIEKLKAKRSKKKGPKNKVILSTIHRAKGLEWENVILVGLNELILPHGRNIDDADGLEEERRLAYVAITRTKNRLVMSKVSVASVMGGPKDLLPSRFIDEMQL